MKNYIITVLGISWILTAIIFINPQTAINNFAVIMFVPLILTLIFKRKEEKRSGNKIKILKKKFNKKAMIFGCVYPIGFIIVCATIAIILRQARIVFTTNIVVWLITEFVTVVIGLFSALGEEYGWRGFLLPELTKVYGRRKAVLITGLVWSLYHIPAVYLLAKLTGIGNPIYVCIVQAIVVFVSNFAFSYCFYLSESIIPVVVYHSIWNTFNTAILGDIYNGKQGIVNGNIFLINGEGILGLIIGVIAMIYFWRKLQISICQVE